MARKTQIGDGIRVVLLNESDRNKMGAYRLWIGPGCYYIGSTSNIGKRAAMHQHKIRESALPNWKRGKNSPTLIRKYLDGNPGINLLYMELLVQVEREEDLVNEEQDWFNICCLDPKCINFRMTAYRKVGDQKIRPTNIAPWVPKR